MGVATPGGDSGGTRAVQVHRKTGLAVGSLFHFMQTPTHTFGSLKIIHGTTRRLSPTSSRDTERHLAEWGRGSEGPKPPSWGEAVVWAQVWGRRPFAPEKKCRDRAEAPGRAAPLPRRLAAGGWAGSSQSFPRAWPAQLGATALGLPGAEVALGRWAWWAGGALESWALGAQSWASSERHLSVWSL